MFSTRCRVDVTFSYEICGMLHPCNEVSMSKGLTSERLMNKGFQRQ